ncbi:MAG: hypothetical protein NW203_10130 [Hyphomonadaceae bacterium]|nr:hypothetical protein [Hyphomonadaceae bacterium]
MKTWIAAALLTACLAAPAAAGTMEAAHANTITSTDASGATLRWHFNADNSYHMAAPDGSHVAGRWALEGGQLCMVPQGGERACVPFEANKGVGDTWVAQTANGPVTVSIVAGR